MKCRTLIPIVCAAVLGASSALAVTVTWTNPGTGAWSEPTNWDLVRSPVTGDLGLVTNGGTITIDATTTALCTGVSLGSGAGTSGHLQITGGSLTTASDLRIGGNGNEATGTATMSGGSITISPANLNVGFGPATNSTANGTFTISGGSLYVQNAAAIMAIGNRGTGTVNQTGGTVFAKSTGATLSLLNLGRSSSNPNPANGTYSLSGGSVTVASLTYGSAVFAGATNVFALSGTGELTVGTISITNTSATNNFNFTGGTLAVTTVNMSLTNNGGTLKPGGLDFTAASAATVPNDPTGTLTFGANASYTQNSGTLAIDIDGPGSNDFVTIGAAASNGSAVLAGTIAVTLLGGYDPALGTTFDILTADNIANSANITGLTDAGYRFAPSLVTGGDGRQVLRLTVATAEPDVDNDQMGDLWEAAHGLNTGVNDAALDPDTDGLTNLQEYGLQTDPQDNDSDNDGLRDGVETRTGTWVSVTNTGTHPLLPDSDHDGLADGLENPGLPYNGPSQPGSNPNIADTDNDLFSDGEEVAGGSNPKDNTSLPNPAAGSVLALDFETGTPATQPGFTSISAATGWAATAGAVNVTVVPLGSCTLDSRDRAVAGGGNGYNPLFRDFLFANASGDDGDGLEIMITGLSPLTSYPVTLWAYDPSSVTPPRRSTWYATDGGNGLVVKVQQYSLDNTVPGPSSLNDRRMDFTAKSDAAGTLVIRGLKEEGYVTDPVTHNVFINGLMLRTQPPPLAFTQFGPLSGGAFPLTWTSQDNATYKVERTADFQTWTIINGNVDGQPGTTTFTDIGITPADVRRYYRVTQVSP
ncbi:MAG TPA: hypothetical protein VG796_15050 [Verrucomicrobiales bacterium]|nr:hypothetical protein [Verrucomicrobiales bacterium]